MIYPADRAIHRLNNWGLDGKVSAVAKTQSHRIRYHLPCLVLQTIESLSMGVFETWTASGRGHLEFQDIVVSQTFIPIISNGEKILDNVNLVV